MKYCTVANKITPEMQACINEMPRRGGFYNWMFLFRGEIRTYDDILNSNDFEKYDVLHFNGAPSDQILVNEARRKIGWNSDTKIVLNNDHVCEVWDGFKVHHLHYMQAQRNADMVFGTEHHQTSNLIDGAFTIPHPHWIHMLKRWGRPDIKQSIGFLYHWWESKSFIPGIWSYKLKDRGIQHRSKLYAYIPKVDMNTWTKQQFDELIGGKEYPDFVDDFISNNFVVDYCGYHTYGRTSVDMAAIGVPMIGSNRIESMNRCFPELAIDPLDGKKFVELATRLWTDEEFYCDIIEKARKRVEFYNYVNSKRRFLGALEEVERRRKKNG